MLSHSRLQESNLCITEENGVSRNLREVTWLVSRLPVEVIAPLRNRRSSDAIAKVRSGEPALLDVAMRPR